MRKKHIKTEYEKKRFSYRRKADRHVLVLEADMTEDEKRRAFGLSDQLRICGNQLTAKLSKRMRQLFQTKKYRGLQKAYGRLSEQLKKSPDDKGIAARRDEIGSEMEKMQGEYRITKDDARHYMEYLGRKAGLDSVFALARFEDIWAGVEKVLHHGADSIHFKKRGDLPEIRAKQFNKAIIISVKDGKLYFKCQSISDEKFSYKPLDKFQSDEVNAVIAYLKNPEANDHAAVEAMENTNKIISTYRPCYASLVCKKIRGKLRVYIHLTIEGKAMPKFKRDGITPRHTFGTGRVGADIGTQTVAYTSDSEVGLKNLSERGMTISHAERQERLILRKMDRSRRAMNPDRYSPDGMIKRGAAARGKKLVKSKRYLKLQEAHAELCRKNTESRKYAIREDANHLRSLGDELITEKPNFKALQKRAKKEDPSEQAGQAKPDSKGTGCVKDTLDKGSLKKNKRRKRFGKSLMNRCPGMFQAELKAKFESTGGSYHEVDKMFRASQYDHTADDHVKKKLSQRMFPQADGTVVQRDWYSSFLLYNADNACSSPDRDRCLGTFIKLHGMQLNMIDEIKRKKTHVMNSGITVKDRKTLT